MNSRLSPSVFWGLICLPVFHILQKIFGLFQVRRQGFLTTLLPQLVQELIQVGLLGLIASPRTGESGQELSELTGVSDIQRHCHWNWDAGPWRRPRVLFSTKRALLGLQALLSAWNVLCSLYTPRDLAQLGHLGDMSCTPTQPGPHTFPGTCSSLSPSYLKPDAE